MSGDNAIEGGIALQREELRRKRTHCGENDECYRCINSERRKTGK